MKNFKFILIIIFISIVFSCNQDNFDTSDNITVETKKEEIKDKVKITSKDTIKKDVFIIIKPEIKKKINQAYINWVNKMVKTDNYKKYSDVKNYYEKTYAEKGDETPDFWDNCKTGLPDSTFINKHYGDINNDGIIDCSGTIWPYYCNGGTARNWDDIHLFILSKPNGSYYVKFEPTEISENIGIGGSLDSILPNGVLKYEFVDFKVSDPLCCPSVKKDLYFILEKDKYELK